jgi:ADP-ribose pyrophosphatase YjhB (NUDIX family)
MKYVSTLVFTPDLLQVALIKKLRPAWLKDQWTAIGGQMTEGALENPWDAACREVREETDLWLMDGLIRAEPFCFMRRGESTCTMFAVSHPKAAEAKTMTDEEVKLFNVPDVFQELWDTRPNKFPYSLDLHMLISLGIGALKAPRGKPEFLDIRVVNQQPSW